MHWQIEIACTGNQDAPRTLQQLRLCSESSTQRGHGDLDAVRPKLQAVFCGKADVGLPQVREANVEMSGSQRQTQYFVPATSSRFSDLGRGS